MNYVKAAEWYKRAAESGNSTAQLYLAGKYDKGEGVYRDKSKAIEWYKKAANKGQVIAQYNLGCIYRDGDGVTQNYAESIEWFNNLSNLCRMCPMNEWTLNSFPNLKFYSVGPLGA